MTKKEITTLQLIGNQKPNGQIIKYSEHPQLSPEKIQELKNFMIAPSGHVGTKQITITSVQEAKALTEELKLLLPEKAYVQGWTAQGLFTVLGDNGKSINVLKKGYQVIQEVIDSHGDIHETYDGDDPKTFWEISETFTFLLHNFGRYWNLLNDTTKE